MRRRTVLQGTAAVAAISVAGSNQASASVRARATAPSGVTPAPPDAARIVNGPAGQAVQVPADLGVEITVGPGGARASLRLTYDDRLYAVAPRPVLVQGARVFALDARSASTGVAHGRTVELALPELTPGTYTVHAGGMTPMRFPADLVADPLPTEVRVSESTGAATAQLLSRRAATQGLPWGVQLGAGWSQARWGDAYSVWYPAVVTLHSVGPGVAPAGSRIRVTLDHQVFESVRLTDARGSNGERIGGVSRRTTIVGQPSATWTTHTAVESGSRFTVTCVATARPLQGALDYVEPPLIEFVSPRHPSAPQRLTGEETQTRTDNIYSPTTKSLYQPT